WNRDPKPSVGWRKALRNPSSRKPGKPRRSLPQPTTIFARTLQTSLRARRTTSAAREAPLPPPASRNRIFERPMKRVKRARSRTNERNACALAGVWLRARCVLLPGLCLCLLLSGHLLVHPELGQHDGTTRPLARGLPWLPARIVTLEA